MEFFAATSEIFYFYEWGAVKNYGNAKWYKSCFKRKKKRKKYILLSFHFFSLAFNRRKANQLGSHFIDWSNVYLSHELAFFIVYQFVIFLVRFLFYIEGGVADKLSGWPRKGIGKKNRCTFGQILGSRAEKFSATLI